ASYNGHAPVQVNDETGSFTVDVHVRVVHNSHNESKDVAKAASITSAVWRASRSLTLGQVPVRVPSLADAAVVGLILSRSWSTDANRLRPRDYLDLATLSSLGLDRAALESRSAELGCRRTVDLFLRRCDPNKCVL